MNRLAQFFERLSRGRAGVLLLTAAGLLLAIPFVVAPLEAQQQAWLAIACFLVFLLASRLKGRGANFFLVMLSVLISARYLYWRLTDTLDFSGFWAPFLGTGLLLAELYAVIALLLAYLQSIWPLERKPVPLPDDPAEWPVLDIYIPTYNEPLSVVKPSVFGALAMDWPKDKMNVYILDDGRREEFRAFAEDIGCGYMIRPDNKGAKAGNINHALTRTKGEFILIFDCDHVPVRAFPQMTLGWMLRDPKIGMLQTPHHFYSPDPFERNLASGLRVPNEGLLFYGLIQSGNDLWNATFFCGSCAVIRRTALEEVGGVPHQTVTEDCHCSLKMQRRGWRTAYLRLPLAAGLATERLALHIGQRMRWARGMIQIFRVDNPFLGGGKLSWTQKFCYVSSMWHFMFPLPRFVFLTSPLAFLIFGQNLIAASPLAIAAYAGPHVIHAVATNSRLQGSVRHSFWSEIYETVLTLWLLPVMLATLLDPKKGKFNVTDKGGVLEEGFFDVRAVYPNAVLALVMFGGLLLGIWGLLSSGTGTLAFQAYALNTLWLSLSLFIVLAGIAVGRERRQVRERARVSARLPASVVLPDGRVLEGHSVDLSLGGAAIEVAAPDNIAPDQPLVLDVAVGPDRVSLPAQALRWQNNKLQLRFTPQNLRDEGNITRVVLCRADSWLHWDSVRRDRPMRALYEVGVSIRGLFRGDSQLSLRRNRRPVPGGKARRPGAQRAALLLGLGLGVSAAAAQPAPPPPRPVTRQAAPAPAWTSPDLPAPAEPPAAASQPVQDGVQEPGHGGGQGAVQGAVQGSPGAAVPAAASQGRVLRRTLRELGLQSPMQLRGLTDLQGVLFGVREDEVVTGARLVLRGATSPALIPELSQIAVTLNEQFIGAITPERARPSFGPLEFPINPVFFADTNRLNFRFTGRYAAECNDPLSGLLWSTISDQSVLEITTEHLAMPRDLARLPAPFFDRVQLRAPLVLPFVVPAEASNDLARAALIASSWFAVQADYRGASFPVSSAPPTRGHGVVVAVGADSVPGVALPRFEGPTLALVPNPTDPEAALLVVGGRTGAEAVAAAQALAVSSQGLSGEAALVSAPDIAPRQPYDAPRWIRTERPVRFGELVDPSELQSYGFAPGNIAVPFRTAPDVYTWRQRPIPVDLFFRAPPGPVADLQVSRLDVSLNGNYLKSLPLREGDPAWPWNWVARQLGVNFGEDRGSGSAGLPPYLVFGLNNLQMRFDMRPLNRGDCTAIPGDIRASIDPDSTIDLSRSYRFTTLPNLAFFAGSGFPYTKLADLSDTALVLPDRPTSLELSNAMGLIGRLSANTGVPALRLAIAHSGSLDSVADRNLLVVGALNRVPGLARLLRDGPVHLEGNRLQVSLPGPLENFRNIFLSDDRLRDRTRLNAVVSGPGDGQGIMIGAESPLQAGRTLVAITGTTPQGVEAMLNALSDPDQLPRIQGDVAWLAGGRIESYRISPTYSVGSLPIWLWPQLYLGNRPDAVLLLVVGAALLLAIPSYWIIRRRVAARLRAQI